MTIWVTQIDDELIKIYNLISPLISGNKKLILCGEQCISLYLRDEISNRIAKKHGIRYRYRFTKIILSIKIVVYRNKRQYRICINREKPHYIEVAKKEQLISYIKEKVTSLIERYTS